MLGELLRFLKVRRGGLRSRMANSVSLRIRSDGLMFHSTDIVLQRSRRDILCGSHSHGSRSASFWGCLSTRMCEEVLSEELCNEPVDMGLSAASEPGLRFG